MSPAHAPNSPAEHDTAMHSFAVPPMTPSASQKGNLGSMQAPSWHVDPGLCFVHADKSTSVMSAAWMRVEANIVCTLLIIGHRGARLRQPKSL